MTTTIRLSVGGLILGLASAGGGVSPARADLPLDYSVFAGARSFAADSKLGEGPDELSPSLAFGLRLGYGLHSLISLELEGALFPASAKGAESSYLTIGYRANALFHLTDVSHETRPFALIGFGGLTGMSDDDAALADDTLFLPHVGAGFKQHIAGGWGLRVDGRCAFPKSRDDDFGVDLEFLVGIYHTLDRPESEPATPAPVVEEDADGDGVRGAADSCPDAAEDRDGFEDDDGCPEADNDGDGVADADDKCINDPESANGIDDEDGCPETDEDGDGLVGSGDQCPTEAEDQDGYEDENGCPDNDNDGDAVADADDKCATELENKNGFEDDDGCPDELPAAVQKFTGRIEGIKFKNNSAEIAASSKKVLNAAAKVLVEYPALRMEIQGHTDNAGAPEANLALSQARAEAVRDYLVSQGVGAERLTAKGYGPDQPVADNATAGGRAQNRRVEFVLQ